MLMARDGQLGTRRLDMGPGSPEDVDAAAAAADCAHEFLRSAWFEAAAPGEVARLAAFRHDGRPLSVLPLLRRRIGPLVLREVPGSYWPFRSFPIAAGAEDEELVELLRSSELRQHCGPAWRMGPVYDSDPTVARLVRAAPAAGWSILSRTLGTCFELDVRRMLQEGPWPRGQTRKRLRNRERKLAELGALAFRSFTGADWTARDREAIASVEAGSWVAEESDAGLQMHHRPQRQLWERVVQDAQLAPMLFGSLLTVGGAPAAFTFGLEVGKVRYHVANGYDQRFAAYGAGKIILCHDFVSAAERGIERISWGSGDEGYKTDWGAAPGPRILDLLFVRPKLVALPLRRYWTGSFGG